MRQADCLTAVIFIQAEESLGFEKAQRALASVMADWSSPSGNLCVLVFRQDTLRGIHDHLTRLGIPGPADVRGGIQVGGHGTVRVSPPGQAELERLMQLMHCRQGFRLADWRQAGQLARPMSSVPGELARHWYVRLRRLTAQDALSQDLLRERDWLQRRHPGHERGRETGRPAGPGRR